jgi:phosphoglycerate dehydrogenase-like enzyme
MIDAEALALLREDAVLINVGRGRLVDSEALVQALAEGRIRGVGVDVFYPEPIPDDHPLWGFPNVLVTPHVSAVTRGFWERETALIEENLRRFSAGLPLVNQVEKRLGY